jgi:hypothetical protein
MRMGTSCRQYNMMQYNNKQDNTRQYNNIRTVVAEDEDGNVLQAVQHDAVQQQTVQQAVQQVLLTVQLLSGGPRQE